MYNTKLHATVSDVTMAFAKSTLANVVASSTAQERVSSLSKLPYTYFRAESQQEIIREKNGHEYWDTPQELWPVEELVTVPASKEMDCYYLVTAELVSYPSGYDINKQLRYETPINLDFERRHLFNNDRCLIPCTEDNFDDSIVMGRAIYSWLPQDCFLKSAHVNVARDTESALPPGEYTFLVRAFTLVLSRIFASKDDIAKEFGFPEANRWLSKRTLLPMQIKLTSEFSVTATIQNSRRHTDRSSVETKGGKNKKKKDSKMQEKSTPQMAM